jgi:hypothetical protein
MQNPDAFFATFEQQLPATLAQLQALDIETLARQASFLQRTPRKIPMRQFLQGLLAVAPETDLSLEHIASVIGLAAQTTYTKQALAERLEHDVKTFLARVITAWLSHQAEAIPLMPALASFARVLVQDSTVEKLPPHLADLFPGSGNQHGQDYASLKIQWIADLKNSAVEHVSLSGFTRNDQAAAPDILEIARPGDLVLRDLGYFTVAVLAKLARQKIAFLTRYRHGITLYDPVSGQPLDLVAELKLHHSLDRSVLLGPARAPVRLVALPVPEEVANLRRYRAKTSAQRRGRSLPGAEHLCLMGWNLFVTNVPATTWPPKTLVAIYRLRWRIEVIFKTWKSHLGLRRLNCRTPVLLQLSVLTKLVFCAVVCQLCDVLELRCPTEEHVSLLRLGHILGQCACWFSATVLGLSVTQWIQFCLTHHSLYEKRKDRKNFYQLAAAAANAQA